MARGGGIDTRRLWMAAIDEFVEFLVAEMEETDSTELVDDLLAKAKALISESGEQSFMTSGSANGKSFTFEKQLSAIQVATACRRALALYNNRPGSSPITFIDFSRA